MDGPRGRRWGKGGESGRRKQVSRLTGLVGDLRVVGSLDLNGNTDESATESILGRGVEHLGLDLGLIGRPGRCKTEVMSSLRCGTQAPALRARSSNTARVSDGSTTELPTHHAKKAILFLFPPSVSNSTS